MSLLFSQGHLHAEQYPLVTLWSEVRIVRQRLASGRKFETALMQMAIGSNFSAAAGKQLQKIIQELDESD